MVKVVLSQRSPLRFVLFLVLLAALIGYVVVKWGAFQERASISDENWGASPVVIVPGADGDAAAGTGDDQAADGDESDSLPTMGTGLPTVDNALYFVDSRIDREQARSARIELLQGVIDNENVGEDARREAEQELIDLSRRITQEADIESLIRARGFSDVMVYLYEDAAVVVVRSEPLDQEQAAQIADAVVKVTGIPITGVSVMARAD